MNDESLSPTTERMKLLIVDDHPAFRRTIISLFQRDEAIVTECSDGYEALLRFPEVQPDWVLMDFDMAPMDGLTATEALVKQFPHARVLLVTSHDGDDLREAVRKSGALGFVRKDDLFKARDIMMRARAG